RMVEIAGVDPNSPRLAGLSRSQGQLMIKGPQDGPAKEIFTDPAPDELGHEPEVSELDVVRSASIELGVARRYTRCERNMDLDPGVADDREQGSIGHLAALPPHPLLADGVVQVPVPRDRGLDRL